MKWKGYRDTRKQPNRNSGNEATFQINGITESNISWQKHTKEQIVGMKNKIETTIHTDAFKEKNQLVEHKTPWSLGYAKIP